VIGQTLAMEGMFAFFLESAFLGALHLGRESGSGRFTIFWPRSALRSAAGFRATSSSSRTRSCNIRSATSWSPDGTLGIENFATFMLNHWALIQFAHNQVRRRRHRLVRHRGRRRILQAARHSRQEQATLCSAQRHPRGTGRLAARRLSHRRPAGKDGRRPPARRPAAMEGKFVGWPEMAGVAVIGEPDVKDRRLDNPIEIPGAS
jgi:cytochrome d ubiquinol oxidase subunit I